MNTRPARVPNVNDLERVLRTKSVRVVVEDDEAARGALADFDRQVAALPTPDDRRRKSESN